MDNVDKVKMYSAVLVWCTKQYGVLNSQLWGTYLDLKLGLFIPIFKNLSFFKILQNLKSGNFRFFHFASQNL